MASKLSRSLRFIPYLVALAWVVPAAAWADTYGLPPFMDFEKEWRLDETDVKGPDVLIARTPEEWSALWKNLDAKAKDAPPVDFGRWMIVGVVTPADQPGRAVYRIELDDAAHPKELRVRVAADGALCQKPRNLTIKGARVHLVATGVSALAVRFFQDDEVDGGAFGMNEGVDQKELGKAPAVEAPALKGKAAYREQAERLVRESLPEEDAMRLRKAVWPGFFGERYPQPWSMLQVRRGVDGWDIEYDRVKFTVNAETGDVAAAGEAKGTMPGTPDKEKPIAEPASFVRVTVKGTLLHKEDGYYVKAADGVFPTTEALVRLERSEDKNRTLDDRLKTLEGKTVVVEGFLDCRSIGAAKPGIELHLSDEKQVRETAP